MVIGRNNTGIYSITFEPATFGLKLNDHVEEIPTENAIQYPGVVFVLSKQPLPSTEGISI